MAGLQVRVWQANFLIAGIGLACSLVTWKRRRPNPKSLALLAQKIGKEGFEELLKVELPVYWLMIFPFLCLREVLRSISGYWAYDLLCDLHRLVGDTYVVYLPLQPQYIVTTNPANVQHVLKTRFNNFVKGDTFFIPRFYDLLGRGIFNVDGDMWYHQRKVSSRMFTKSRMTNHIWNVICKNTDKVVEMLRSTPHDVTVDIFNIMNRFTLDTIGEIGFGRIVGAMENADSPFMKSFDVAQQVVLLRLILPAWRIRRFYGLGTEKDAVAHFKLLKAYSLETVQSLKANLQSQAGDSFLGLFMQDDERTGRSYDEELMQDMVLNFLIAGRDTTAQAMSWAIFLLLGHPDIEEKVHAEIAEVCGGRALEYEDLNELVFLQAVVNESLRLYPSVPFGAKCALNDDELPDGTFVSKGAVIAFNFFAMGRSKQIWGDDADAFNPERWLLRDCPSPYCYPVFNAGPRECLGKRLATIEMKACLVRVLQTVKLSLAVPREAIRYDIQPTLGMSSGLPCKVAIRK